jgi:hypothetical protein
VEERPQKIALARCPVASKLQRLSCLTGWTGCRLVTNTPWMLLTGLATTGDLWFWNIIATMVSEKMFVEPLHWTHDRVNGFYLSSCGHFVIMKKRNAWWEIYIKRPTDHALLGVLEYSGYLNLKTAKRTATKIAQGESSPCSAQADEFWRSQKFPSS